MKKDSWNVALRIMANISGWIAFPVIIGLYLGKWLDQKFGTDPWLFLATIMVFFFISMYGLVTSTLKEAKRSERDARQETIVRKPSKN
ncbi:MAG: AtpZ/AtpI family protein [Patescibacteria group bacterium]